jgi:hypothetical protein
MRGGTGAAPATGLELLRRDAINQKGVNAPEGVIDPAVFFGIYAGLTEPPTASAEELLLVRELAGVSLVGLGAVRS